MNGRIVVLVLFLGAVIGCSGGGGSSNPTPTPTPMASPSPTVTPGTFGDFTGAGAIAIQPASSAASGPAVTCTEYMPTGQLVKLDESGNPTPLLNEPYDAAYFVLTSANLIVRGTGFVTEVGTGVRFSCCVLAIPRVEGASPARCLSEYTPADGFDDTGDIFNRSGITTSNNAIYIEGGGPLRNSVLWWDGSSSTMTPVLQLNGLQAAFAATGAGNICANSYDGMDPLMVCGDPIAGSFAPVADFGSRAFQIGSLVWKENRGVIDLRTLSVATLNTTLNFQYTNTPTRALLDDGSMVAVPQMIPDGTWHVVHLSTSGAITHVQVPTGHGPWQWEYFLGSENFGMVYGHLHGPPYDKDLRLIDFTTLTMSTANYMPSLNLIQVSGFEFAGPSVLQINGTGSNGLATSVFIDAATGAVTTAPPPEEQYIQVKEIE